MQILILNYTCVLWSHWINTRLSIYLLCCSDVHSTGLIAPIIEDVSVVNGTKTNNNHHFEKNTSSGVMLNKHWGSTHTVQVYREANKSLGISIVGGKVSMVFNNFRWAWKCHRVDVFRFIYCKLIWGAIRKVLFNGGNWNTGKGSIYIILTFTHFTFYWKFE